MIVVYECNFVDLGMFCDAISPEAAALCTATEASCIAACCAETASGVGVFFSSIRAAARLPSTGGIAVRAGGKGCCFAADKRLAVQRRCRLGSAAAALLDCTVSSPVAGCSCVSSIALQHISLQSPHRTATSRCMRIYMVSTRGPVVTSCKKD